MKTKYSVFVREPNPMNAEFTYRLLGTAMKTNAKAMALDAIKNHVGGKIIIDGGTEKDVHLDGILVKCVSFCINDDMTSLEVFEGAISEDDALKTDDLFWGRREAAAEEGCLVVDWGTEEEI